MNAVWTLGCWILPVILTLAEGGALPIWVSALVARFMFSITSISGLPEFSCFGSKDSDCCCCSGDGCFCCGWLNCCCPCCSPPATDRKCVLDIEGSVSITSSPSSNGDQSQSLWNRLRTPRGLLGRPEITDKDVREILAVFLSNIATTDPRYYSPFSGRTVIRWQWYAVLKLYVYREKGGFRRIQRLLSLASLDCTSLRNFKAKSERSWEVKVALL